VPFFNELLFGFVSVKVLGFHMVVLYMYYHDLLVFRNNPRMHQLKLNSWLSVYQTHPLL